MLPRSRSFPGAAQRGQRRCDRLKELIRGALQTRDRTMYQIYGGPGSAAHHSRAVERGFTFQRPTGALALHRIRDTLILKQRVACHRNSVRKISSELSVILVSLSGPTKFSGTPASRGMIGASIGVVGTEGSAGK